MFVIGQKERQTETSALTSITGGAYWNFDVDYWGVGSYSSSTTCQLTNLLNISWADCRDMSALQQICINALGGSYTHVRVIDGPFRTKKIDPIGNPTEATWRVQSWNFHQVGWEGNVWDACLRLKESDPRIAQQMNI